MSLEQKIDELKASLDTLTAAIQGGFTGKAATTPASEKPAATEKPASTRRTKAADKVPTQADMKKAAEAFLDKAGDNEKDYNDRRAHIKKIIAQFDSPKFTEIAEGDRKEALEVLAGFTSEDDKSEEREEEDNDI